MSTKSLNAAYLAGEFNPSSFVGSRIEGDMAVLVTRLLQRKGGDWAREIRFSAAALQTRIDFLGSTIFPNGKGVDLSVERKALANLLEAQPK